ncbi:MAG: hypothetical protein IJ521_06120 [Schwartzia sp.]|nr:hypothetical protein [Schwartzia sp. (in: firmicutes)]
MKQKLKILLDRLADCGSLVVALSGGVDSSVLARAPATGARVSTTPAASAQLTRVQANELVNKILPKYQPLIDNRTLHTKGGDFRTVYASKRCSRSRSILPFTTRSRRSCAKWVCRSSKQDFP